MFRHRQIRLKPRLSENKPDSPDVVRKTGAKFLRLFASLCGRVSGKHSHYRPFWRVETGFVGDKKTAMNAG